jgi:hypothetical protein
MNTSFYLPQASLGETSSWRTEGVDKKEDLETDVSVGVAAGTRSSFPNNEVDFK